MSGSSQSAGSPAIKEYSSYRPYLYTVICLGMTSIAFAFYQIARAHLGYQWMILAAVTVFTSAYTIKIPAANSRISIGDTFFFTNIILYGTPAGVITAALDALVSSARAHSRRRRLQYCLFNVAAISCSARLVGMVFSWAIQRGPLCEKPMPTALQLLFPLAALAFTHYLCNSGSVAAIVALEKRMNIIYIWKDSFLWTSITYFAGAAAAGVIALTMGSMTIEVVGVSIPILLAIYFTYKTYLSKVQEVRSLAYYDKLTALPNRLSFEERLNQTLVSAQGREDRMLALMFLDVDNFKRINDTYGHGVGDLLLKAVAERLTMTLGTSDRDHYHDGKERDTLVGRFGGDEFTILMGGIDNPQQVVNAAQRILEAFSQPFALGGRDLSIAASIGIIGAR